MVADIAKLSAGREEHYTRELATDHEQYLSGHGEPPGRWYGAGATSLGLQGEASVAGFQAMFEGRDPTTGELQGRVSWIASGPVGPGPQPDEDVRDGDGCTAPDLLGNPRRLESVRGRCRERATGSV